MKRKRGFICIGIMLISLFLIFYLINNNSSKHNDATIDLIGGNTFWQASLNIIPKYNSELIIRPSRDDFKIPSEIEVDIVINNKTVYTDRLKYIPDSNKNLLGKYMVTLDSVAYFKSNINDVNIIVKFNNESSSILLNLH